MDQEQLKKLGDQMKTGTLPILKPDDTFKFQCTACGHCCFDIDVMLNPMDVYFMARSKMAQNTYGVKSTTDLFKKGLLTVMRGSVSKFPICCINFVQPGKKAARHCPFLVPKHPERYGMEVLNDLRRYEVIHLTHNGVNFVCGLHEEGLKPAICRLSPLGRIYLTPEKDGASRAELIWQPIEGCPGVETEHKQVVSEYVKAAGLDKIQKYSSWWYEQVQVYANAAKEMDDEMADRLARVLYDVDGVMDLKGEKPEGASQTSDEETYFAALQAMVPGFFRLWEMSKLDKAGAEKADEQLPEVRS